eukprot:CAMPEP_0206143306 /NCGR_PEP_ID=MMETSP1473-20131121/20046_1 /ASSEMBLY_ACC=CAM_ASM_001109 /TAXON_ID=1461547 /ORGANISM="Stichococcus sp, Strain RCC1054" /LENGTH=721 /DNA_ID=CAMNT_0053538645 /DNA_START=222 /DNA_END=2387 /DNA_ORIENTATION=+
MQHEREEEDALLQLLGIPYELFIGGSSFAPRHEKLREDLRQSEVLPEPPKPQVGHILTLIAQVFHLEVVIMTLCAEKRVYIRNATGFAAWEHPFPWETCDCGASAPANQVQIIEDVSLDNRMVASTAAKAGSTRLRFFAGLPLKGSSGHKLGDLMLVDAQPRRITAEKKAILANMAELVVRELEKDAVAAAIKNAAVAAGMEVERYMRRALTGFEHRAVLFVELKAAGDGVQSRLPWQALHTNAAVTKVTGLDYTACTVLPLWELFTLPFGPESPSWQAMCDLAGRGDEFVIQGCTLAANPHHSVFTIDFRPGRLGSMDEDALLVSVPSYVSSAPVGVPCTHYFAVITPQPPEPPSTGGMAQAQAMLGRHNAPPSSIPFENLELGQLLGQGSFGRVYRGRFHGSTVAVKICSFTLAAGSKMQKRKPWHSVEALQSRKLSHPGVMRTYKHLIVLVQEKRAASTTFDYRCDSGKWSQDDPWADDDHGWDDDHSGSRAATAEVEPDSQMEAWYILEFCNRGSLQSGVDQGLFQHAHNRAQLRQGYPNYQTVLLTARDIASAMEYLHACEIIHGDLCGGNVLLTTSKSSPHGFTVKVADFGLARSLEFQARVQTATYGTVTHMPPELLTKGKLSKAADVYAFGILVWEMVTGTRAWAGMSHTQVLSAVGFNKERVHFPTGPGYDQDVAALATACLLEVPEQRPTFTQIVHALDDKIAEVKGSNPQ